MTLDEDQRLALVEGMIAQRHHVGARREKAEEDLFRDAKAMRGILAIDHDQIRPVPRPQAGKLARHGLAARSAHHIAQKDQPHAKVSRSVITWSRGASCPPRGTPSTICAA